jgi:hypothetical protein
VLAGELQDVNHAQFTCLRLLAAEHGQIFVVRDDDQSVFAGAVRNHLHSSLRARLSGDRANPAREEFPAHRTDSASCNALGR